VQQYFDAVWRPLPRAGIGSTAVPSGSLVRVEARKLASAPTQSIV